MKTGHASKNWGFICHHELYLAQHENNEKNHWEGSEVYNGNIKQETKGESADNFFYWYEEIKLITTWKLVIPQHTEVFICPHELYFT